MSAFDERPAATVTSALLFVAGVVTDALIAGGSVGAKAVRAGAAEQRLAGVSPDDATAIAEAADLAAEASQAVADANGAADYKLQLVRVLVERSFREAAGSLRPFARPR